MSDIKPLVVVLDDKFDGVYSGGKWTAWNLCYVPSKIFGDAKECADFFSTPNLIYGRGETPQEAIDDLKMILDCGISDPDEKDEKDEDEEDEELEPTSVWEFENLDDIWISQEGDEMSLLLKNEDNLTKIILTGDAIKKHNDEFVTIPSRDIEECNKVIKEIEKKMNKLEEKNKDSGWKKNLEKEIKRLENKQLKENIKKLEQADMLDKEAADYWSKEHDTLSKRLAKLQEENDRLKKELSLEKAANEAQRKFITLYAGKDTEVQFNYAIDETGEVSYVVVEKERYQDLKDRVHYLEKEFKELQKAFPMTVNKIIHREVLKTPTIENFAEEKPSTRADILDQAKKCVCGQREQDYGTPESNFQLIADLWNGYLGEKTDNPVISVTPVDVSMMMALMKIARIRNGGGSGDSFVDLAGYAACGGEIWHMQNHKDQK